MIERASERWFNTVSAMKEGKKEIISYCTLLAGICLHCVYYNSSLTNLRRRHNLNNFQRFIVIANVSSQSRLFVRAQT